MPSRVIHGSINGSDSLSRVGSDAELLFRALLMVVDDYGRGDARLPVIKALCFPLRREFDEPRIRDLLAELCSCDRNGGEHRSGPVRVYEHAGRPYLCVVNWELYRWGFKRAKRSRFPAPPLELELVEGGRQLRLADARERRDRDPGLVAGETDGS